MARVQSAGGIREWREPWATPSDHVQHPKPRYVVGERPGRVFNVFVAKSPPDELLLSVEIVQENNVFYMRAIEVDVSVEEEHPGDVLRSLRNSVKDWLEYLAEENPILAPDMESQRRYVALLDFDPLTWFRARTLG